MVLLLNSEYITDNCEETSKLVDIEPYTRLWRAVILQLYDDLRGRYDNGALKINKKKLLTIATDIDTIRELCEYADLNFNDVNRVLQSIIKEKYIK